MEDHDQRFKTLLREFFPEFFQLFFPEWADWFDFGQVEWLDKEVFTDPPTGERRFLDVVAKLPLRQAQAGQRPWEPESWIALIHVEIEHEDTVRPLRPRMYQYYEQLRRLHQLPVLPIGLYLSVGRDGLGTDFYEEFFGQFRVLRFDYLYVGLPTLDAEVYLRGNNWLGVALAALMRCSPERRSGLTNEALRRLIASPENDRRRYLLCECVCAYSPLDEAQSEEFEQTVLAATDKVGYSMKMSLIERWEQRGWQKGRQEGRQEGERLAVQTVLEEKFGPLPPEIVERLNAWPAEELASLLRAALRAQSLGEIGLAGEARGEA